MIYILLSSCLFILGQLDASYSVLCSVCWIIPLIVYSRKKSITFVQGFLWGVIVFSFHLSWILVTLWHHGAGFFGMVIWVITLLWFAIFSGVWLYSTRYSWIVSTGIFFLFVTKLSLILWGRCEGYPFMYPLLPFMHFFRKEQSLPADNMIFIKPWWHGHANPMFVGYRIADHVCACAAQNQKIHSIIMPESTFCFDIQEYQNFIPIWSDGCENVVILLGTHRKNGDTYLNSAVMVQNKKIIQIYDKQHFMPFIESPLWGFNVFNQKNNNILGHCCEDVIFLGNKKYQIYLCSELFFEAKKSKNLPILMLWNDSWLEFWWVKQLALKYIYYFAWKNNVPVLHASTMGISNILQYKL